MSEDKDIKVVFNGRKLSWPKGNVIDNKPITLPTVKVDDVIYWKYPEE